MNSSRYSLSNGEEFNGEKIQGSCHTMCPQDEADLRVRERMVHILERVGTERRLVKSYSRSAADSNMAVPGHLRPFKTLRNTVIHLLFVVINRTDVPIHVVYDFVNDRLRAVRQDLTIQRLPWSQCQQLLEPMVRFYIYFGYRLHGLDIKDFDPVLNKKYLLECLKWFLNSADQSQDCTKSSDSRDVLDDMMKAVSIEDGNRKAGLSCDRVLMESLYILCNLNDMHPLYRYLNLPRHLKEHPTLKMCYTIAVANLKGNYGRVTKCLRKLCPLLHCALCIQLPELQRRGLQVMCYAYSSSNAGVPAAAVARWLSLASEAEARETCRYYGLVSADSLVRFHRTHFDSQVPIHRPQIRLIRERGLGLAFDSDLLFTYTTVKS